MEMLNLLLKKYGPTMDMSDLGECLKQSPRTLINKISAGSMPIATWVEGRQRLAMTRDVATYLDTRACLARARERGECNALAYANRRAG